MVNEFKYEYEGGRSEPIVETFGSPSKCTFCDKPTTRECHCWADPNHCSTLFVCEEHWKLKVWREFITGMFWNFGYRRV